MPSGGDTAARSFHAQLVLLAHSLHHATLNSIIDVKANPGMVIGGNYWRQVAASILSLPSGVFYVRDLFNQPNRHRAMRGLSFETRLSLLGVLTLITCLLTGTAWSQDAADSQEAEATSEPVLEYIAPKTLDMLSFGYL